MTASTTTTLVKNTVVSVDTADGRPVVTATRCVLDRHWNRTTTTTKQLHTRLSWVLSMIALGTVDVIINLCNNIYFSDPGLKRCLVIGPPTRPLWIVQTVFTAVSVAFYVAETVNTVSIFRYGGETNFLPIHLELLVTLPLEHIPLAAVNYFTARCRQMYATPTQIMLGAVRIVFIFVRMVWYAHIEGKKVKKNDKYKIKRGFFMLVCVLFSCSTVFPIMIWRESQNLRLKDDDLRDVSLYFLNLPDSMEGRLVSSENADYLLYGEGYPLLSPWLVESLLYIKDAGDYGYNATYSCDHTNTRLLPKDCDGGSIASLAFKLVFHADAPVCRLGEIRYNYARINSNKSCVPSVADVSGGWRLLYFNRTVPEHHQSVYHANLSSPWYMTCVTPEPWYDRDIDVCPPS